MKPNNDILVIPDAHAHPEHDNDRFDWLGEYILEHKPGAIVCIGDLADLQALSSYDEGTRNAWGRLYKADCNVAIDAQQRIFSRVEGYNEMRRRNKQSQYLPRRIFCAGNHEDRADRFVNAHPAMDGFVNWREDIMVDAFWDEFVGYKDEITVHGVAFSHYFSNGLTGRPISGVSIARTMCHKLSRSAVQGHSHIFCYHYTDRGPDLPKIQCWSCGCYSHPDQIEGWNRNTAHQWEYGILHLRDVNEGYADGGFEWVPQKKLQKLYGN